MDKKTIPPRHDHWAQVFKSMEVGDKVHVANEYGRTAAHQFAKRHKMIMRTRADDVRGGFCVWRVA